MNTKTGGYTYLESIADEDWIQLCTNGEAPQGIDILENEYLILKDPSGSHHYYKKSNGVLKAIPFPGFTNYNVGEIKPRNPQQYCAMDMCMDPRSPVKLISGTYGAGKDYIMLNAAFKLLSDGAYDKILYIRNNIEVANTVPLGRLPGEKEEKLRPFLAALTDHVGGWDGLEQLMYMGKIEAEHLGYLRGRNIQNTIIYVTEAENLTKEHIQLLLGRVGEGSALWLNGDYRQVDKEIFKRNSGMLTLARALADNPLFAYVDLPKTERSAVAALADELDRYTEEHLKK